MWMQMGKQATITGWVVAAVLSAGSASAMDLETGSFLGNGSPSRAITGLGFAPELMIVRSESLGQGTLARTSTMAGGSKALVNNQFLLGGRILSLDADGFTVSGHPSVNASGAVSHWIAFGDADDGFAVGTYQGDGVTTDIDISDTSSSPDFQPDYMMLISESQLGPLQAYSVDGTTISPLFGFTGRLFANDSDITSLTPTGFTVRSGTRTNEDGVGYHYVAWRERFGTAVGTYVGDGAPGELAIDLPFEPDVVGVTRETCCVYSRYRQDTQGPDSSFAWAGSIAPTTDAIQSFTPSGFAVGDSADVGTAATHFFVAWKRPPPVPGLSAGGLTVLGLALVLLAARLYRRSPQPES